MAASFTEAAADALGRSIAAMQREVQQAEKLRDAQLRARLAEIDVAELRREAGYAEVRRLLDERLASLRDGKDGLNGEPGRDGRDVTLEDVAPLVDAAVARAVEAIPVPMDGRDAPPLDVSVVEAAVAEHVERAVAAIPKPKDGEPGRDGKDVDLESVARMVIAEVDKIPPGRDGKDADPAEVSRLVDDVVARAVAALPVPSDGRDAEVDYELIEASIAVLVEEAVAALPKPKDGERGPPGESIKGDRGEPGPQGESIKGDKGDAGDAGERGPEGAPGKLPLVRVWADEVHYEGDVVFHNGGTFQALRDTGRAPQHEDWICIAHGGRNGDDGRSFTVRGTWAAEAEYRHLDVVVLNGGSFVARKDDPGDCPGEGWQLIAAQGKRGNAGERGPALRGDPGKPGLPVVAADVDVDGLLTLTNGDGSVVTCDLYPLLDKALR